MTEKHIQYQRAAGFFGLLAVTVFIISLLVFGGLNPDFSFLDDYISKLGAIGEPNAIWWNLIGFLGVGILLIGFGVTYGVVLKDKIAGILLSLFGLGFALTAIPIDMEDADSSVSKAHVVAISLALAAWLFGLARISYNRMHNKNIQHLANIAALILVSAIIGFSIGIWSMPMTHRLVFGVVFSWTAITAADLLINHRSKT